jgi:hypothetical protein
MSASNIELDDSPVTSCSQRRTAPLSRCCLLISCLATNAQMEREVMRMELSISPHNDRMRPIFAKCSCMKFKSGMAGALTICRIACKHTKRDRSCTSSWDRDVCMFATQLRRRTKRDSRKTRRVSESIDEMRSGIWYLGILAANLRNLCLSTSASRLNSQLTLPGSPSFSVSTARKMMLFSKPSVRNRR